MPANLETLRREDAAARAVKLLPRECPACTWRGNLHRAAKRCPGCGAEFSPAGAIASPKTIKIPDKMPEYFVKLFPLNAQNIDKWEEFERFCPSNMSILDVLNSRFYGYLVIYRLKNP